MGKVSYKKIQKLIKMGRLVPIIKSNEKEEYFLVGYKRKSVRSSKSNEAFLLPEPQKLTVDEAQNSKQTVD